ncbi:MAG: amino acid permease [Alphaproteobacteria bacterium]|nr:amino acid permease [Alphaproteobacteria bacterium]
MRKLITPVFLVAGTCIGGGMLALPMVLAKLGIAASLLIMLLTWLLTYYSSLISVELNIHSDVGLSLGQLGRKFSGRNAEIIGEITVKLLSYALLAAFIYGTSSIIQKLLEGNYDISIANVEILLSILTVIILLFPTKIVSNINNVAFSCFLIMFILLIIAVITAVDCTKIPWFTDLKIKNIAEVITVIFTSFGYQVIFHTLRDYCGKDVKTLRMSFLIGSFIPAFVYMLWAGSTLSVIFKTNSDFFIMITEGKVDVGTFVSELANVSGVAGFQILTWNMAIFAILTSILGVGIGLNESLNISLSKCIFNKKARRLLASILTVIPAYILAAAIPNAFTKILGFAGAILVIIAILLPTYLFFKADMKKIYLSELNKYLIIVCSIIGIAIIISEFVANNL